MLLFFRLDGRTSAQLRSEAMDFGAGQPLFLVTFGMWFVDAVAQRQSAARAIKRTHR